MHMCLQPETHYSYIHACRVSLFLVVTFFLSQIRILGKNSKYRKCDQFISAIMFPEKISKTIDWFHLA